MNRLKLFILGFVLALSIPLAYFAWSAYRGLEQEEFAQLRFFAETLFNEMEQELASLVKREENRAIDEYNYTYALSGKAGAEAVQMASPLSETPKEPYILGYFQNNPDGSFQTPLVPPEGNIPDSLGQVVGNLEMVNEIFNGKRTAALAEPVAPEPPVYEQKETAQSASFEDKFLDFRQSRRQKSHLGTEKKADRSHHAQPGCQPGPERRSSLLGQVEPEKSQRPGHSAVFVHCAGDCGA